MRRLVPEFLRRQRQPRQIQRNLRIVLQHQHHLKQRAVAHAALRLHRLDHLFEWHILVSKARQRAFLHLAQQLCHRRHWIQPRTKCQRVHEEPDQPFQLAPATVGHRRADHHIILATQPAHQYRKSHLQHHEQGCSMAPGQHVEPCRDLFVQFEWHHATGITLHRRPYPVRRQLQQRRRTCQFPLPEGRLLFKPLIAKPLPLPLRVIRILDRQR